MYNDEKLEAAIRKYGFSGKTQDWIEMIEEIKRVCLERDATKEGFFQIKYKALRAAFLAWRQLERRNQKERTKNLQRILAFEDQKREALKQMIRAEEI